MFSQVTQSQNISNTKSASKQAAFQKHSTSSNTTGIPLRMKVQMEEASGFSMDDVRVHYNSDKPSRLQALAYTEGNKVYIGPNQQIHLQHELGHVLQQKQGKVQPTGHIGAIPVNTDKKLEYEADHEINNIALGDALNFQEDLSSKAPVVQRQNGLQPSCRVYVYLEEGTFQGVIENVSIEHIGRDMVTFYDITLENLADRVFLKKDILKKVSAKYVEAQESLMDSMDFISMPMLKRPHLAHVDKMIPPPAPTVQAGKRTRITTKKELPEAKTEVFHHELFDRAAKAYPANEALDGTAVFHLGSKSGALLMKTDGVFRLVYLERQNEVLEQKTSGSQKGQFGDAAIKSDFNVDQVITTGISSCSFIAMTNKAQDFLAVAHLDVNDEMFNVVARMQTLQLKPTILYASIIDTTREFNESKRIKALADTFSIQDIRILNRTSCDRATANAPYIIGIDLGTGKDPALAGDGTAPANGGRPFSVFGELGSDDVSINKYLKGWLQEWKSSCQPGFLRIGPVITGPILNSLCSIGLGRMFDIVIYLLRKYGGGDIYKGILNCTPNTDAYNELFQVIRDPLKRKAFSEKL